MKCSVDPMKVSDFFLYLGLLVMVSSYFLHRALKREYQKFCREVDFQDGWED